MSLTEDYSNISNEFTSKQDHFQISEISPSSISTVESCLEDQSETFLSDSFLHECSLLSPKNSFPENSGESPLFFKFLTEDVTKPNSNLHIQQQENSIQPKKSKIDEISAAKLAHENLRKQKLTFEDLQLTSKQGKKDTQISLLGSFFKKFISWSSDTSTSSKIENHSQIDDVISEEKTEKEETEDENIVHLGLIKRCVTKLEYYSRELRQKAQISLFQGKKNVAFLDKVEVLEIPRLKKMSKRVKSRMFYTRNEYVGMIAANLKEVEIEARRKLKRQRKKQYLSRS